MSPCRCCLFPTVPEPQTGQRFLVRLRVPAAAAASSLDHQDRRFWAVWSGLAAEIQTRVKAVVSGGGRGVQLLSASSNSGNITFVGRRAGERVEHAEICRQANDVASDCPAAGTHAPACDAEKTSPLPPVKTAHDCLCNCTESRCARVKGSGKRSQLTKTHSGGVRAFGFINRTCAPNQPSQRSAWMHFCFHFGIL